MFYCGIDLAGERSAVCVVDEQDRVVYEGMVKTEGASWRRCFGRFPGVLCLVEASPLAETVKREVEGLGYRCEIIDTRRAKGFFEARKKTDQRDARTLARMARVQWYHAVHAKSAQARLLRSELTMRAGLVSTRVGLQNQVLGLLRSHGVRVKGAKGGRFAQVVRGWLVEAAELQAVVEPLLVVWESVHAQVRAVDRVMVRRARSRPEVVRLRTVPGVGVVTALAFVATVDDPGRFTNGSQVGDYVGLAPGVYQSGDTEHVGRVTRQGDRLLRTLLVEAANSILYHCRKPWAWKRWAEELRARKGAGKARVALARRLAGLLWRLWKDEAVFELRTA